MKKGSTQPSKDVPRSRRSGGERFAQLAAMGEQIVHARDLANLWNIHNSSTLSMTLARYASQGLIHRIQKGLYSIKKPADLDPFLLGVKAVHSPAYISCETVLFQAGVMNQPPIAISLISGVSRRFTLAGIHYHSRQLSDAFLFNDAGIDTRDGVRIASVPRAIADTLYFNSKKYFAVFTGVSPDAVCSLVRAVGYPESILKYYANTK